jgi:hypothetical protein
MEWNAYHFVGTTLRDGSPIPADGVTLRHGGSLKLCRSGLHASRKAWQALKYAPGHTLCRVHCSGEFIEPKGEDKLVCSDRTIVARIDAEQLLFDFARSCALDVRHLWDAPDVVNEFLGTGAPELRAAARDAARDVAWAAAWDAARAAAWDVAWDVAWAAAWDVAWAAARAKQRARFTRMANKAFGD